jgi:hypothetical protein
MVSWFRFYAKYWQVFCAQNAPVGHVTAIKAHKAFLTVEDTEDLIQWFQDYGKVPGVFLAPRSKVGKDGRRKIDALHHLRLIQSSGGDEEDYVVGILQLGGGSQMSGILVKDLTAHLVPAAGKRLGTRGGAGGTKDSTIYVPTLESLMANQKGPFGKNYIPKVGEECLTVADLVERPSLIFIPFYLWSVICERVNLNEMTEEGEDQDELVEGTANDEAGMDESGEKPVEEAGEKPIEETNAKEDGDVWSDLANSPLGLARELSGMMSLLERSDPNTFRIYRVVAQNLLDFLWAANNNITPGIRLRSTEGDIEVMKHTRECLQEFLTFAEEGKLPADPFQKQEPVVLVDN